MKFAHYGNTDKETPFPEEVRWLKATQKNNERKEPEFFSLLRMPRRSYVPGDVSGSKCIC